MTGFAAALYQNLPFPALIVDAEAHVVSHNDAAARAFGWNRNGQKPADAPIIDGADVAALLARHAVAGRENTHAFSFRHDNGSLFEATAHVIAVSDEPGGARYALLLRSLLSGGSHGEQILLGQRIAAALDTMNEGFAIFDQEERLVMFNRSYKERCGHARDAVRVGATLESIARASLRVGMFPGVQEGTPEAEETVRQRLESHRNTDSGGSVFQFGKDRWIRGESHVAETGDIVALRVDVSELKRAEAALEEKRRDYLSLLQILPDMILRFDRNLTIRFANDKYAAHVGSTTDELVGRYLPDVACAPEQTADLMNIDSYTREAPVRSLEVCTEGPDGKEDWMFWTAVAIFDESGVTEVVSVGRDITEAKHQQHKVEAQTNELRRKNEALDQFTATVSHDLKAPLRHLSMFAEMISEDLHRGEFAELAHYSDHVRKSAARMRRIIDSLLEFSQIAYRITSPKPVALADVVRDALVLLETHVQETSGRVDIRSLPEVMGDPELLKRLAQNLIGNALKYHHPDKAPVVRVYSQHNEAGIAFVVEDDGIGIDPQHVERIFDVFQRLHRDESVYQGTGVGLALARRIVESHNGVIALDTTYGPGARFVVTFPQPVKSRGNERGRLG
ncbi:PAS domain S-box protein [Sinorhizobium sp. RAC02]|uniref:PAS domain S-box protein n=1 Tax=Sinorhizobium sp. RAC02 TaxID=1842534 RepID=UPI00083CFA0F|nr:PAS domain S-box protein [Sinorhizobium sp. RAC02]AOF89503.1 sensory box protein [Sinorhizobium sp. RAC02]